MTIDIEQLRKDMAAGTQGDWRAEPSPFEVYNVDHGALTDHIVSGALMICALYEDCDHPDAHRIVRLPQLEREYIALREAADQLAEVSTEIERKCQSEHEAVTIIDQNRLTEALTAYRKATQ